MPVFLLVGQDDEVVPAEQGLATAGLLGAPAGLIQSVSEPCNHLALFMGAKVQAGAWTRIAAWLRSEPPNPPGGLRLSRHPPPRIALSPHGSGRKQIQGRLELSRADVYACVLSAVSSGELIRISQGRLSGSEAV